MGKKSPKTPEQPDPYKTADAQAQANVKSAIAQTMLNQTNQVTPYGSVSYRPIGTYNQQGQLNPPTSTGTSGATSGNAGMQPLPTAAPPKPTITTSGQASQYLTPWERTSVPTNQWVALAQGKQNQQNQTSQPTQEQSTGGTPYDAIPRFEQVTELSPEEQNILKLEQTNRAQQNDLANRTNDMAGNYMPQVRAALMKELDFSGLPQLKESLDYSGLNPLQTSVGANDFSADRQRVEDAIYKRTMGKLQPEFDQERRRTDTNLINRGFSVGNEGYTNEMDNLTRRQGDQRQNAVLDAIVQGGNEQSRLFGLDLSKGTFANQARAQGVGEQVTDATMRDSARGTLRDEQVLQKTLPVQLLQQLRSMGGQSAAPIIPNANGVPQSGINAPDISSLIQNNYQAQLQSANAKSQANASTMGSIFGLAGNIGAAYMLSDERTKDDIELVDVIEGIPQYEFSYKGGKNRYRGAMAQDLIEIMPEAVHEADGLYMVDYSKLPFPMEAMQ